MPFLYAVTSLFQFVIFVALTGILFSIAAISLLMEITIAHFVQPMTTLMLRQSGKIAIFLVNQSARSTCHAFDKMCGIKRVQLETRSDSVDLQTLDTGDVAMVTTEIVEQTLSQIHDAEATIEPEITTSIPTDETSTKEPEETVVDPV